MSWKRMRRSGPLPLAVRLAAADDSEDEEPWHQNMTLPRSSQALPTSSSQSSQALPPSKRSSQALHPSSSRSSEAMPPPSQSSDALLPSSSQSSQAKGLSSDETNQLVGRIIKYLLSAVKSKNVIQRPQLLKTAFGNYGKHYRQVMPIVKDQLLEIFGFRLVEFESGKYITVNGIPNDLPHLQCPVEEKPCRALLTLVLTHIFMLDGKCSEDLLWSFLRYLKIIGEDDFNSTYIGDVQKVVCTDFVKQQYLNRSPIGSMEPPKYEFEWGIRAKLETSKRHMLTFVSKMFEDCSLKAWPNQYKSMLADERTADR